jgi:hypothetical protein
MAQNGSGTEATWAGALSLTGTFPFGGENSHHVIFENETASILANGDEANAIFFFSFGKFSQICTPNPSFCSGSTTSTFQLGDINNIKVDKATIATQLPGSTGSVFPVDRLLYNVYSNGSNPDIVPSSTAALNVVSEDGFLCKPSTSSDVDPNTGKTYLSEIDATITAQGFFPIPLSVEDGQGATTGLFASTGTGIPHPAWTTGALSTSNYNSANESFFPARDQDTDGTAVSGTYNGVLNGGTVQNGVVASSTAPVGYCITLTTDGNANN